MRKRFVLLTCLFALWPATAQAQWHTVHLKATPDKQRWRPAKQPPASATINMRFYKRGHRIRDGLGARKCNVLAAGHGVAVIAPCAPSLALDYWGRGRFTFVYRVLPVN